MKKLFLLLPLFFCLYSCWDYSDPGEQNYVLGVGVDYEDNQFNLCLETVKITGEPTSLSDAEGIIIYGQGETLIDAVYDVMAKAGKTLYWGHTELVIMSEVVASKHLNAVCDVISRSRNIYSNVNLVVSQNVPAREILTAKTPPGGMVSAHISNILKSEKNSHRFISCELWQLNRNFEYTLIPAITLHDYPIVDGSAVIKDGFLAGYLSGDETQIYALFENSASGVRLSDIMVDNVLLSTRVLDVKKEKSKLNITLNLLSSSTPFDTISPQNRKRIEEEISALLFDKVNVIASKDFGNTLSYSNYEVEVTLEGSGLVKR